MNYLTQKTWYLYEDPELKIVHASSKCPGAKIAVKYSTLVSHDIKTKEDAEKLDASGLRPYGVCLESERRARKFARGRIHVSPPGFRS